MEFRELRNVSAHDCQEEDLISFFKKVIEKTPQVLKTIKKVNASE